MPDEEINQAVTTEKMEGIPLYLIPNAISILIRKHGEAGMTIVLLVPDTRYSPSVSS